jgi:hypothetical protein
MTNIIVSDLHIGEIGPAENRPPTTTLLKSSFPAARTYDNHTFTIIGHLQSLVILLYYMDLLDGLDESHFEDIDDELDGDQSRKGLEELKPSDSKS